MSSKKISYAAEASAPKNKLSPKTAKAGLSTLEEEIEQEIEWQSSDRLRRAKASFLVAIEDNPLFSIEKCTPRQAAKLAKSPEVSANWNKPGFQAWLMNRRSAKEKLQYLQDLVWEEAEILLRNSDPKVQSAKVNVMKMIMEVTHKDEQKQRNLSVSSIIDSMDRAQLEAFLGQNGAQLKLSASKGPQEPLQAAIIDAEHSEDLTRDEPEGIL